MARKDNVDRGIVMKPNVSGEPLWYVRLYHNGNEKFFGSFSSKDDAREFYLAAKAKQKNGTFIPEIYQSRKNGHLALNAKPQSNVGVYFLQSARSQLLKIGYSSNVLARIRALQHSSPDMLLLVGVIPGTRATEKQIHVEMVRHRAHGEWFRITGNVHNYLATHGLKLFRN